MVGTLVIMAGWSVVTGTYFTFHDDVLKRLIARQAEMQFAYEDRIAELRAQVDRITSRQLLDQEQFEQKLDHLVRKQATLESRATTLTTISADPATTGSVKPSQRQNIFDSQRGGSAKPSPINDTVIYTPPPDREARLESRVAPATLASAGGKRMRGGVEGALIRMQDALDRLEAKQTASLSHDRGQLRFPRAAHARRARRSRHRRRQAAVIPATGCEERRARGDRRPLCRGIHAR